MRKVAVFNQYFPLRDSERDTKVHVPKHIMDAYNNTQRSSTARTQQ